MKGPQKYKNLSEILILIFGEKRVKKIKSKKNSKNLESNLDLQKVTLIKKFCLDLEKPPYLTKSPCSFKNERLGLKKWSPDLNLGVGALIVKMHVIKKSLKPHFITQHLLNYLKDHYLDSPHFLKTPQNQTLYRLPSKLVNHDHKL